MADNATKIATLQAILDAGAAGVSVDGESVKYDLAAIRKEIRELKAADPNFRNRRPRGKQRETKGETKGSGYFFVA